jgi:hypothetical protein
MCHSTAQWRLHHPPQLWTGTRTPLVSSHHNIWTSYLICIGICRNNYIEIPNSVVISTFCIMRSRVHRANNCARPVCNHMLSFLMAEIVSAQVSLVHPMPIPSHFISMHSFWKNTIEVYIFLFKILSSCLDSLEITIHCHLLQFPFVWWNRWNFFSMIQTK